MKKKISRIYMYIISVLLQLLLVVVVVVGVLLFLPFEIK